MTVTRIFVDRCVSHRAHRAESYARDARVALTGTATIAALNRADNALKAMIEDAKAARLGVKRLRTEAVRDEKRAARDRAVIERDREAIAQRA